MGNRIKFIHVSDTHLGCKVPSEYSEIREKDFLNAFKQVINFAIDKNVDFVIHSGDFFDERYRISLDLLYEVSKELARLKENDITFISIKGNHDLKGSRGKAFDQLVISKLINEAKIDNPIEISDVVIYGMSEPKNFGGETLKRIYYTEFKNIKPKENYFNILVTHTVPNIFGFHYNDPRILPIEYYPKGFDYYAFGHFHIPKIYRAENSIYALPGSTEYTKIDPSELKTEKGFYFYNNGKLEFIRLKTRRIKLIDFPVDSEDGIDRIYEKIVSLGTETIIKLIVLVNQNLKDTLDKAIFNLKLNGYKIIYEPIVQEIKIEIDKIEQSIESFDSLIQKILEEELSKFENKEKIREELEKILNIYDLYGIDRIRDYIVGKIKYPLFRKGLGKQKTLLEW